MTLSHVSARRSEVFEELAERFLHGDNAGISFATSPTGVPDRVQLKSTPVIKFETL